MKTIDGLTVGWGDEPETPLISSTGAERSDLLTITMTREEWDAAIGAGFSYAGSDVEGRARRVLHDAVEDGQEAREEAARAEVEANLPRLTARNRRQLRVQVARLVREHVAGRLKVDHLGHPETRVGRFTVSVTPHIATGGAGLHFAMNPTVWFKHREYDLHPDDRAFFIALAREITGQQGVSWNDRGPWVSVQWNPVALRG